MAKWPTGCGVRLFLIRREGFFAADKKLTAAFH
jgi:hypothetical protein